MSWNRERGTGDGEQGGTASTVPRPPFPVPYVELHAHSAYSLREGASTPLELVLRARELGYDTLALTDHDALYGAMAFATAATCWGVRPITGAELSLTDGHHLTVLAATREGYGNLCRLISHQRLSSPRDEPRLDPACFAGNVAGLIALSGCARGEVPSRAAAGEVGRAAAAARRYAEVFGPENFYIELQQNLVYGDTARIAALAQLAHGLRLGIVATNNVHYHIRARHRVHDVLVAIRHRLTLDTSHQQRRANSEFYLKSAVEMAALFTRYPEAIATTRRIADRCTFNLAHDLEYRFPRPGSGPISVTPSSSDRGQERPTR